MQTRNALDIALQLYRQPALAHKVRRDALPPRVLSVIKIAAGSEEEIEEPSLHAPEEMREMREAAIFFLQNCLFQAGGDSYRVLGVEPDATIGEVRVHKRWLLKWLHPDINRNTWEAGYLQRVLAAWDEVAGRASASGAEAAPSGLTATPRNPQPRYRRYGISRRGRMPVRASRFLRRGAIALGLSIAVILAFRQAGGIAWTHVPHLPGLLEQQKW